jgi:hypothetical protein
MFACNCTAQTCRRTRMSGLKERDLAAGVPERKPPPWQTSRSRPCACGRWAAPLASTAALRTAAPLYAGLALRWVKQTIERREKKLAVRFQETCTSNFKSRSGISAYNCWASKTLLLYLKSPINHGRYSGPYFRMVKWISGHAHDRYDRKGALTTYQR